MIKIGIDSVEIERFIPWTQFPRKRLVRIFSTEEISYSFSAPKKTAERLAVRFAAKEAFYKALMPILPHPAPFLSLAKHITITCGAHGAPQLDFPWKQFHMAVHTTEVSLTHTASIATALVFIYLPESALR